MKKIFLILLIIFTLSCGNPSTLITPPGENLVGTYELFDISGGWLYGAGFRTFDDTSIVHGTLWLGGNSFNRIIFYSNDPLNVPSSTDIGTYNIAFTNGTTEGNYSVLTSSMFESGTFKTSGMNLTFDTGSGQATWTKISDSTGEVSARGIITKLGVTTFMYGTHAIRDDSTQIYYALMSDTINLDNYIDQEVSIKGNLLAGYPVDGGPDFVNVTSVE
ncbi:MAG: hypothetical protein JSV21_04760 [Nitrospirota bacterium]|nr:MAG: hypothetical protein JSV21_04760 [Nitrospirota bacterium]